MKHIKIKKLIATALVITTAITSVNMTALADVSDTGGNTSLTGGGPASGGGTTGMFFETLQSGYRIYIIDENGNRVSNTIDICYGNPYSLVDNENVYTNAYNEGLSKDQSNWRVFTWEQIQGDVPSLAGNIPTAPLTRNSVSDPYYLTHGDEFKQWVINGIGGETLTSVMGELAADTSNSNPFRNTTSGGSGSNTSSSLTGGTGGNGSGSAVSNSLGYDEAYGMLFISFALISVHVIPSCLFCRSLFIC